MPIRCAVIAILVAGAVFTTFAGLPPGAKPPLLELSGSCGGRLDGTPWSSSELGGKVYSVYYVDPDEADLNEPLYTALKAENFPDDEVQSVAIINMKATWIPGPLLSMALKRKQKKYTRTTYVKDNCRLAVTRWQLADQSSDVLLFNAAGEVIFSRDGLCSDAQIRRVVDLIRRELGGKKHAGTQK